MFSPAIGLKTNQETTITALDCDMEMDKQPGRGSTQTLSSYSDPQHYSSSWFGADKAHLGAVARPGLINLINIFCHIHAPVRLCQAHTSFVFWPVDLKRN